MSSTQEPLALGITAVQRRFETACEEFGLELGDSDDAADAVDFTGHMHALALAAGRVLAFGEALTLLSGDQSWTERASVVVRPYLD